VIAGQLFLVVGFDTGRCQFQRAAFCGWNLGDFCVDLGRREG
jgi:hypothetical protein